MGLLKTVGNKLIAAKNWFLKRSLFLKIVIVLVLAGGAFLIYKNIQSKSAQTPQYQTAKATKGELVVSVNSSGQVASANSETVSVQTSGVVNKVYVTDGQKVKKGDTIATLTLDTTGQQKYAQAMASYQSAQNSLANAQANYYTLQASMFAANQKFTNDAVARGLTTDDPTYIQENDAWLAAEASFNQQGNVINAAQSSLSSASYSLQLASPTIKAPIAGSITGLMIQSGSVINSLQNSTQNLVSIANIITDSNPLISVNLTEIDIPNVKIGDKAILTFDALTGKTFTGKVVSIDKVGTISSGVTSYPTMIQLDTTSPDIFPNMSVSANIITNIKDNVLLVPSTAVSTQNGQTTVKVLKNGKVTTVQVQVGDSSATDTEITTGLNEGGEVVTSTITSTNSRTSGNTRSIFSGGFGGGGGGAARVIGR